MSKSQTSPNISSVYGPVRSWRLGMSLGIDLLCVNSICSFRCIYCQLGKINIHTISREIFVSTEKVIDDLKNSNWQDADVITFSGNGEPTLALNFGEVLREVKKFTNKPVVVLTNATTFDDEDVRRDLCLADKVFCKLDAADEKTFQQIDKPVKGVTLQNIIEGIKQFRNEYKGQLAIQIMLQKFSLEHVEKFAKILNEISPDEIQLNTPSRSIPRSWFPETRGNHYTTDVPLVKPAEIAPEEVLKFEAKLKELLNEITSVYSRFDKIS